MVLEIGARKIRKQKGCSSTGVDLGALDIMHAAHWPWMKFFLTFVSTGLLCPAAVVRFNSIIDMHLCVYPQHRCFSRCVQNTVQSTFRVIIA
jgi:hypothetical protein